MCETVNTVKIPMKKRISFVPRDDDEKKYVEALEEILTEKRHGDWKLVGNMLGITPAAAEKSFIRVHQKNHFEAVEALKKVISNRKALISQNQLS